LVIYSCSDGKLLVDPNAEEEASLDGRMVVAVDQEGRMRWSHGAHFNDFDPLLALQQSSQSPLMEAAKMRYQDFSSRLKTLTEQQ
jgi:exosome complex RNA-binding protein Rrp42 (RNase PH superfamily)